MPAKPTALLIDANALLHRAWHALPPLTSPSGQVVNAVYGFTSVLFKILQSARPTYLAVCWDTAAPTFRHEAAPEYKAQREEQPQAFYDQIPLVKDVVEAIGGKNVELDGYEADDLLATLARKLEKDGVDVTLLTSDRDVFQLIGPRIRVMAFKKGVSETVLHDEASLLEATGLSPAQIADFKALRGDASDNLKGVPGIGEKTATDLLRAYGDLKGIFKAAHDPKSGLSPSVRQKLLQGEQAAKDTLPLVRLVENAPLKMKTSEIVRREADADALKRILTTLGFKTLLARIFAQPKAAQSAVSERKPKTGRPKPARGSAGRRHTAASVDDLRRLIDEAREGRALIFRPVEAPQASLFADVPALVLGSPASALLVPNGLFGQKDVGAFVKDALEDETLPKVGHGMKSAWHWAADRKIELRPIAFDTELAAELLAAGERIADLPSLAAARLGIVFSDGDERPFEEVEAIRALVGQLGEELAAERLDRTWERFERPLIPVLGRMERDGILIDRAYFQSLSDEFRGVKQSLEKEMERLAGEPFNPGSPQQLAHVLFEVLNLPAKGIKRGKTGISTAASELEKLEGAHPIVSKIMEYREVAKLLSTYVEALPALADADGRVHTTYNQLGAATGRMSSTNPNLQNIPIRTELGRKIRRGFIAPKGRVLLSCDYSQIELRVIAALAKDRKMIEAFEKGIDIHVATAAAIWGIPLDDVTKDQRRAAKAINFGIIYGQGPVGLAKAAGVPFEEAKRFIEEYFHVYSGVREYLDQTKALAHANGYVETLFGRRRPIPDINSPLPQLRAAAERMATNMPVQGTATADLPKLAMIDVAKRLPALSKGARMLLQVHDELVFEVPEKEAKGLAPEIVDIMQNVEKIGVPIVVDAKIGPNWDEMRPV